MRTSVSKLTRLIKWAAIAVGVVVGLIVLFRLGLALTGLSPNSMAHAGQAARHSPALIAIRYLMYVCVWFCWQPMVRHYMPDATDELVKRSRKTLLIVIALYEVMCWIRYFF